LFCIELLEEVVINPDVLPMSRDELDEYLKGRTWYFHRFESGMQLKILKTTLILF
jgi:hypothetical protein